MSRVGKQPIAVPGGVEVKIDAGEARVKGPKGELFVPLPRASAVEKSGEALVVSVSNPEDRTHKALWGLTRALLSNAVHGVSTGFEKGLIVVGVGYRADLKGKNLDLNIGFSHPVSVEAPNGIEFGLESPPPGIDGAQVLIKVMGADKELVGRTAADIRSIRPPEPYKGKGIRYRDEHVRRKAGKSAV